MNMPATASTTIDSKHMLNISPNPLPSFSRSQANSTFTIRVPRLFLSHVYRETITFARRIWGTDILTDDSDPIAAAIHGGWIRGAWAEGIDLELILGIEGEYKEGNERSVSRQRVDPYRTLTSPPTREEGGPVAPPGDRDAHITLLILPPLEKYESSVFHGIKSRVWGGNHDGMSLKIIKIEWVDGCDERGGRAAKRRIASHLAELRRARYRHMREITKNNMQGPTTRLGTVTV